MTHLHERTINVIYIRICFDAPGAFDIRMKHRAERREYLYNGKAKILQGGPLCAGDDNDTYIGTFMLIEAESREEVVAYHDEDPFTKLGVFERSFIVRYDKHMEQGLSIAAGVS
jgi:uncharacterized protein YciI